MKVILSQDGAKLFTVATNQVMNISEMAPDETGRKFACFSVGIESISFGLYERQRDAAKVLREIAEFISADFAERLYVMPEDGMVNADG